MTRITVWVRLAVAGVHSLNSWSHRRLLPALPCLLVACAEQDPASGRDRGIDVRISVEGSTLRIPDSIHPGWRRVRVEEDGAGHIVVVFRLVETTGRADSAAVLQALDTAAATPALALALGGPEVGDTGEVLIHFAPGNYVIACVRRGRDGHRHARTGEAKFVTVPGEEARPGGAGPPAATHTIRMVDFAYAGPEQWMAGPGLLRIENTGQQDHQVRIARLRAGASVRDWLEAAEPGDFATAVAGVARMGSGAVTYLPVHFARGEYVMFCLVPDPASGKPHVEMGMLKSIHVE